MKRFKRLTLVCTLSATALLLACDNDGSSGPGKKVPDLSLPEEPEADCHLNISERLAGGEGYCYETSMLSHDGTEIAMQVFVPQPEKLRALAGMPADSSEPGYAPLVIHHHGFGGSKAEDFAPAGTELDRQVALDLWQSGYWVISMTQRGFGGTDGSERPSGGQTGFMAADKEGWDFVRVVDWAICHLRENAPLELATDEENADPEFGNCGEDSGWGRSLLANDAQQRLSGFDDDVALGTLGYSYGSAAVLNSQSVDARVDALLPMGGWFDVRRSLHPNDTPKYDWIFIMTSFVAQGSNGEPLPPLITEANVEATGFNTNPDDVPYNKKNQISVKNMNVLAPVSSVAYCDGNAEVYGSKFGDADNEPVALDAPNRPAHATTQRAARADLFMIHGYGDTLFPFDEGFDAARCFEDAGVDTYLLMETSGHPLPVVGPPHYAGSDMVMYLDEIVHCGVDADGNPVRYNTRELGFQWFEAKLRNAVDFASVFPHKVCINQENADTALVLDTQDEFFDNGTTNDAETAHMWLREGVVYDQVADILVGGTPFDLPPVTLTTGAGSQGQGTDNDPRVVFTPLSTVTMPQVIAGIPTANLSVTRANPLADEIFFAGIAVKRCQNRPQPDQDPANCEDNPPKLLHVQAIPIRIFPADSTDATQDYPRDDPRNFPGEPKGHLYPVRWGDNPQDQTKGRLYGVSARLYPGDQVGLLLMPENLVFTTIASPAPGQVTVEGSIELPLVSDPNPAPVNVPNYVIDRS